ncbi:hypothetical protein EK21DRAFT_119424 [Setomelanomma holmii]|uniref:Uncharacterized protein n=1 Tax=Setomelanomma holmii TaxID=210430 RepID=A0A9P4GVI2_9PLEO|nr:hypothetical protein EK21DRAFT_119424 [Setomelanomma holmii]
MRDVYEHVCLDIENCRDVSATLTSGPLQQNSAIPPYHFVRRVTVHLTHIDTLNGNTLQDNWAKEQLVERQSYYTQVYSLTACKYIEHLAAFKLRIEIAVLNRSTAEKYEEALVNLAYQLKAKGAQLVVNCDNRSWGNRSVPTFDYDRSIALWTAKINACNNFGPNRP